MILLTDEFADFGGIKVIYLLKTLFYKILQDDETERIQTR